MIDLALFRADPAAVKDSCRRRGADIDLDGLLKADAALRERQTRLEQLRASRKQMAKGPEAAAEARRAKEETQALEAECRDLQQTRDDLWARVPNLLAPDTPDGGSDAENVEIARWGDASKSGTPPHEVIGRDLGLLDLERGAEVAGAGFYYWRGDGARLTWAVFSFALDLLQRRGFEMFFTPLVARPRVFFGTGYLPFFAGETYQLEGQDLALIGTSEQTLIGFYGDRMLDGAELPFRSTAFSACFRTEAGAAGRQSRGAFRVHQFHKVEQIIVCRPEDSEARFLECQQNAQDLMEALELPHRVVRVCVGDLGAPAYKKLDTEAWFPGFGEFRETHSNSNLWDYQARRFGIRAKDGKDKFIPHTISATAITDRAVLAILENHFDGETVRVPKALAPYMGGLETIGKRKA